MQWRELLALIVCGAVIWFVGKSIAGQWRAQNGTPLRGKLSAARDWLEENGYQVIRIRERCEWNGYYDERNFTKPLIADFIVRKGARLYAVKIFNARDHGVTGLKLRDQWYPLYTAFGVHGVLHVDVDAEQVHLVDFSVRPPSYLLWRRFVNRSIWFVSGAVIALAWLHGHG